MDRQQIMQNIVNFQANLLSTTHTAMLSNTQTNTILKASSILIQEDTKSEMIHGGSRTGKHPNLCRNFSDGFRRLSQDYFSEAPVYSDTLFRRRFCTRRSLFLKIVDDVKNYNIYFTQKPNTLGQLGLAPIQKVTAAIQTLAYGLAADLNDEYLCLSETTSLECLERFCHAILGIYQAQYLCYPTPSDIKQLLKVGEHRGFPGMLGSVDCMHWQWKNCPTAWAGQYQGKEKSPTII